MVEFWFRAVQKLGYQWRGEGSTRLDDIWLHMGMGGGGIREYYVISEGENLWAEAQNPYRDFALGRGGVEYDYISTMVSLLMTTDDTGEGC